ncbi:unnamed protein product [Lymnaea stagnalis]|uniref:Peptidase S72 domain-containing protein n=1 Tax=Lymnaea stagnalis TaxID=6523 RepID=A0AAV2IJP0_LYMST
MSFDVDFQQFMRNRRNITNLAYRIGSYFGDTGAKYVTVLNVRQGSLRLFWTNNTLSGTVCRKDAIIKLYQLLNKTNDLAAHLGQHLKLTQVGYELLGACSESPATTTPALTTLKVGSTLAPGFSIWAHVILPVMIAFLVFVLIILIIIFCNRRRRHRQAVINAEKEAISNDRNPIIFPDEMDGDDPVLQAKDPLLLPTDPHPANQETPQTSPKTERDDDTDGRSRDSRDQEWADADSRRKDEHKDKPRRHSRDGHRKHHRDKDSRKHSRDKDRMSGVSASSSLSFDRPNNHYLDEEEAGSRNSTLTSTKSGGSDKRHPKQPPPYWQSQSDPPPYRFPPPYLNNTTQV